MGYMTSSIHCIETTRVCMLSCSVLPDSVRLLCPWDSPGKNTGVGHHALLQGVFPTQGPNPCLACFVGRSFTTSVSWKILNRALGVRK